jgi:protein XagA
MRAPLAMAILAVMLTEAAGAGAWTLDRGTFAVYSGTVASCATRRFDRSGTTGGSVVFNKLLIQNWMEYGLTDAVTLYVAPEYVFAEAGTTDTSVGRMRSSSVEAGARILLLSRIGMLSLQASAKSAGAFDMSVSASGDAGRQMEVRLQYGRSFKLFGRDAFLDVQAAERWITHPRPNEMAVDASAGFWLAKNDLLLLQSFNVVGDGSGRPPYGYYRQHKLQVSLVQRLTPRWALQSGYFFSPAGQNIVREHGAIATIWFHT